jgi:uncharacterized membrane protein
MVEVIVTSEDGNRVGQATVQLGTDMASTDEKGVAEINVRQGEHHLKALHKNYEKYEGRATVSEPETGTVEVTLTKE